MGNQSHARERRQRRRELTRARLNGKGRTSRKVEFFKPETIRSLAQTEMPREKLEALLIRELERKGTTKRMAKLIAGELLRAYYKKME